MSPHLLLAGGEDHDLRIAFVHALQRRGFRVTAAGTGDPAPFAKAGIEHCSYRLDRSVSPLADRATVRSLRHLLAAVRPDIVHSFDTKPNLLVPLAARAVGGLRVVRTVNGLGWVFSTNSPAALVLRPTYRALQRLAARSTTLTVFQNHEDQTYFERHGMIGSGGSRLIPGSGVDVDAFDRVRARAPERARLRESLGLSDGPVVVTVSRITREKGIPTLLRAAALVHRERPDVRFLLVGSQVTEGRSAVTRAEIERHAPYVVALGRRTDVPALLGIADVFAFPSEFREGVSRALLEAALAELPIVTTRAPGCTDVVCEAWSGLLVPPRAPQSLAARILALLNHPQAARAMGARAGMWVRREFGLAVTADRYAALYDALLDGSQLAERLAAE